jgi:hypothetical protein
MARIARDLATPLPGEAKVAADAYRLDLARRDTDSDDDVGSTVYATADGGAASDANKAEFSQAGTALRSDGIDAAAEAEDAVAGAATPTMALAVASGGHSGAEILTLSRVTAAVETAVACFPVDLTALRALPPGVSAAPIAFHCTAKVLMRVAAEVGTDR